MNCDFESTEIRSGLWRHVCRCCGRKRATHSPALVMECPVGEESPVPLAPEPFADDEQARRKAICLTCPHWDRGAPGCQFVRKCVRRERTELMFLRGSCRLGKWLLPPVGPELGRPAVNLKKTFSRVVVIHLARRPERLVSFWRELARVEWPFRKPEVFAAVDGRIVPQPNNWPGGKRGRGSWGCMESHRQVLQRAIQDEVKSLLVLEDDLCFPAGMTPAEFAAQAAAFLQNVPADWDQLMLGGQHRPGFRPQDVSPGVVRCLNCQRTHAYAIRGRFMRDLYQAWVSGAGHCDHIMGPLQANYHVYSPAPFLCGQDEGPSDISGKSNDTRKFWDGRSRAERNKQAGTSAVPQRGGISGQNRRPAVSRAPAAAIARILPRGAYAGLARDRGGATGPVAIRGVDLAAELLPR